MSFANRRHLSVPGPRAALSSLELGSSQEEGPPTPSILVMSPQQATGSDDGYFQSAGDRRRKSKKSAKIGRRAGSKLSGLYRNSPLSNQSRIGRVPFSSIRD